MTPPPNPRRAADARAAMMEYNAEVQAEQAPRLIKTVEIDSQPAYRLAWPQTLHGVCTITHGKWHQWRRNDSGEIEALYNRDELEFCVKVMQITIQEQAQ